MVINGVTPADVVVQTKFGDVLPASADLAGAAVELIGTERREYQLSDALESLRGSYDVIFIDCPPSLEMLTLNGLSAAEGILVPVQCEYYALEGLSDLLTTLRMVKKRINPQLEIFGVALTMFDGRTNFSTQVAQEVRRHFPGKVFGPVIPRNVRLAEAPSHGLPVTAYDKMSRGAVAYRAMAEEIIKKL
jgi:chromosome partitioning protein